VDRKFKALFTPRRRGLQPGRARWSATLAGAGQAPQQAGGEARPLSWARSADAVAGRAAWGPWGDGRGTGGWKRRGGRSQKRHIPPDYVVAPHALRGPLAIVQSYPHLGSSVAPTI
jgi:hypothetical protein